VMAGRLDGRRVLIVGAGQQDYGMEDPPTGNGRAMSVLFAGEGAAVALATGGLGFVASWPGFALWVLARRRTRVTPASG